MTGLFINLDEYIPDPEVEAVERALRYLPLPDEEYDEYLSISSIEGWQEMVHSKNFEYKLIELKNAR
jgi:hypothetical protein